MATGLRIAFRAYADHDAMDADVRALLDRQHRAIWDRRSGGLEGAALRIIARPAGGGDICGIASGFTVGDQGRCDALWVAPALRHRGLGGLLLYVAEATAAERGCARMDVTVYDHTRFGADAPGMLARRGYETVGGFPGLIGTTGSLMFRKRLEAAYSARPQPDGFDVEVLDADNWLEVSTIINRRIAEEIDGGVEHADAVLAALVDDDNGLRGCAVGYVYRKRLAFGAMDIDADVPDQAGWYARMVALLEDEARSRGTEIADFWAQEDLPAPPDGRGYEQVGYVPNELLHLGMRLFRKPLRAET